MRLCLWMPVAASAALLASCGGGGGGGVGSAGSVAVTPTPSPSPSPTPTPTNTSLLDLQANQTFTGNAAGVTAAFDLTNKAVITGNGNNESLTVNYDASAKSYTLTTGGRTQVFAPTDVNSTTTNDTQYRKTDGTNIDYLTLVKVPYTGTTPSKYVAIGYWQRNVLTGTRQDTLFDVFTYGFPTAAGVVPRSGTASFATDVFGLAAYPGHEPRIFQGRGTFSADLLSGLFSFNSPLTETNLLTGASIVGGSVNLLGSGKFGSDSTFSGNMRYDGAYGTVSGTVSGRFFGPAAEEVGAAFVGNNSAGATVNGALTGQRNDALPAVNQALTNLIAPQLFFGQGALLTFTTFDSGGTPQARTTTLTGQLNRALDGSFTYGPGASNLPSGTFNSPSIVASSDPNFVSYQPTFNGQPVKLDLYKPGSANSELVLTYATFGRWSSTAKNGAVTEFNQVYFAYGIETPARLLAAKTGSGHYVGVAYGAGANQTTGALYDIKGTSMFDIDFSRQSYSGAIALKGTSTNGAAAVDFGNFTFAAPLSAFTAESAADLMQNGQLRGTLTQRFFGPDGEEIAGPFTLSVPGAAGSGFTAIAGVAVAKQQ